MLLLARNARPDSTGVGASPLLTLELLDSLDDVLLRLLDDSPADDELDEMSVAEELRDDELSEEPSEALPGEDDVGADELDTEELPGITGLLDADALLEVVSLLAASLELSRLDELVSLMLLDDTVLETLVTLDADRLDPTLSELLTALDVPAL